MNLPSALGLGALVLGAGSVALPLAFGRSHAPQDRLDPVAEDALAMLDEGRATFRHDTFGDQAFWGGELRLHQAIAGAALGGVGPGLPPSVALRLGLKVDAAALPAPLISDLLAGKVDLGDPATTVELLRLRSVVGVEGFFGPERELEAVGITCALCHSTVDDSLAPGIGARLDGWANRDLDVGAIIALAPDLSPFEELLGLPADAIRGVLQTWGPGKFDAELVLDGQAFQPDGESAATLLPPAFGLAGVNLHTWTGWGSVTHWNAFVAVIEMHGQGTYYDPRLADAAQFPIAAAAGFDDVRSDPDLVSPKLPALHFYQLALKAPEPPPGSFDAAAAARGRELFHGVAGCATCHVPPTYTEPGWNLHRPDEIGVDAFQAQRSPEGRYRTSPLRGLWTHQKGGFYHDGRFKTLGEVVAHYERVLGFDLDPRETRDLIQFLLSL